MLWNFSPSLLLLLSQVLFDWISHLLNLVPLSSVCLLNNPSWNASFQVKLELERSQSVARLWWRRLEDPSSKNTFCSHDSLLLWHDFFSLIVVKYNSHMRSILKNSDVRIQNEISTTHDGNLFTLLIGDVGVETNPNLIFCSFLFTFLYSLSTLI